jgi:hypothetical protein
VTELLRPWKLATVALGVGLLIIGSYYFNAPDWDVPVSLIMAAFAYVTAPWSMRVILERRWRYMVAMLFVTWLSVDGCYAAYWAWKDPVALSLMRDANAPASLSLYWMCGLLWLPRCTLGALLSQARTVPRELADFALQRL